MSGDLPGIGFVYVVTRLMSLLAGCGYSLANQSDGLPAATFPPTVIPANAGIQRLCSMSAKTSARLRALSRKSLDSRVRGNDGLGDYECAHLQRSSIEPRVQPMQPHARTRTTRRRSKHTTQTKSRPAQQGGFRRHK